MSTHSDCSNDSGTSPETRRHFQLRRCILLTLYEQFKAVPYAAMELEDIEAACATDVKTLNWNLAYLEKCGFVELGKAIEMPPYIACSAAISAAGIDLMENEIELNRRFPVSVIGICPPRCGGTSAPPDNGCKTVKPVGR